MSTVQCLIVHVVLHVLYLTPLFCCCVFAASRRRRRDVSDDSAAEVTQLDAAGVDTMLGADTFALIDLDFDDVSAEESERLYARFYSYLQSLCKDKVYEQPKEVVDNPVGGAEAPPSSEHVRAFLSPLCPYTLYDTS